ncbi:guanitoxin biosynthesis L-enduracididine beta-hydroxylase GntD [Amycolatopsis mediterranei]|uniref:guanitoxin biosynthesis L-enduracididine beta-hydroxylase GntD n=1 Tax=Amycolatopsis mediterranei TaxID=33910 RepID=UPI00342AF5C8
MHLFHEVTLTAADLDATEKVVAELTARFTSVEEEGFQRTAAVAAHELPKDLRAALYEFTLTESAPGCLVRGFEVDDRAIGVTPGDWREEPAATSTLREEVFFYLCAQLVAEPVAWATQQNGRVMHDILPIRGYENQQVGAGSKTLLAWHTEEAFHPLRADYIALMCLRNHDCVETTYADVTGARLSAEDEQELRRPQYRIRPDPSHLERSNLPRAEEVPAWLLEESYRWNQECDEHPEPVAVLFGSADTPYLRIDPEFMQPPPTAAAARALGSLVAQIESAMSGFALAPGEILFVDNFRAVHGRVAFEPRYDGTDRWLKRLNLVRDLRKSRGNRVAATDRVIY